MTTHLPPDLEAKRMSIAGAANRVSLHKTRSPIKAFNQVVHQAGLRVATLLDAFSRAPLFSETPAHAWRHRLVAAVFIGLAAFGFLRSYVYRAPSRINVRALQLRSLATGVLLPDSTTTARPVVLNLWAPWCPPCRLEMPWLEALHKQYPEVAVIGVEDDPGAIEEARQLTKNVTYDLALPSATTRRILGQLPALPTTLYLSASGRVTHIQTGIVPVPVMRGYLRDTLSAP